jgi:hypothetical protein
LTRIIDFVKLDLLFIVAGVVFLHGRGSYETSHFNHVVVGNDYRFMYSGGGEQFRVELAESVAPGEYH